jgi:1-acyl-sn-glycerol-3-phosphate acyltransferase
MLRGLLSAATFVVSTTILGLVAIVAGGLTRRPDIVFRLGKVWSRLQFWAMGIKPVYRGLEHASGRAPRIFLANHLSALDIWVLTAVLPDTTRFVSKRSVFWIPVLGQAMVVAGFIPIDRKDRRAAVESLAKAAETIRGGASVILFPEGTRSRDGKLAPFKKGAFHLALRAGVPVVPVSISGTGKVVRPRSMVVTPGPVEVTFESPIDTAMYAPDDTEGLSEHVRGAIVAHLAPDELADTPDGPEQR